MTTAATSSREPITTLPTGWMLVTVFACAAAVLAVWAAAAAALGRPAELIPAGAAGAALVAVVTTLSLLAIQPWKPRVMSSWITMWLAAMVLRLPLTPVLAYLLYSATPFGLIPLMLSVAVTYVIVQIGEAAALSLYLKRLA